MPLTFSTNRNSPVSFNNFDADTFLADFSFREVLTADTTYYVRTDGNDSNDGLTDAAGGAFLTVTHAIDVIQSIDLNQHLLTLHIGTGTWTGGPYQINNIYGNRDGTTGLVVEGNGSANTSISLQFDLFTNATVQAMKLDAGTGDSFASLWVGEHSEVFIGDDVIFNATVTINTDIYAYDYGAVTPKTSTYSVRGAGTRSSHVRVEGCARYNASLQATAIAVSNTPTFSVGFVRAKYGAQITLGDSFTSSGTITGKQFDLTGSAITFNGAITNLPGSGGVYKGVTVITDSQLYTSQTMTTPTVGGGVYLADVYGASGSTPHYGYLRLRVDDATGASEDATWRFGSITAGTHADTFSVSQTAVSFAVGSFPNAVNDAAAAGVGVAVGQLYRNGSILMVRIA